jgi:hypothetical protein
MRKLLIPVLFIFSATTGLYAQYFDRKAEAVDTVEAVDEDYSTFDSDDEYSEDEDEVQHTLIEPAELTTTKEYQSQKVYHRTFDETKWRNLVGEQDYRQDRPDPPGNLPSLPWAGPVLRAIGYGLIIAIVGFLLYYILKNINLAPKPKPGLAPFAHHDPDDIQELDLPTLLKKALDEKNFRLAVRYYYLSLLKNLDLNGMIKWEKDKTNRDYLSELFAREYFYPEMRSLTRSYEEVWYSDHEFAEPSLRSLIGEFESLHTRINTPKTS